MVELQKYYQLFQRWEINYVNATVIHVRSKQFENNPLYYFSIGTEPRWNKTWSPNKINVKEKKKSSKAISRSLCEVLLDSKVLQKRALFFVNNKGKSLCNYYSSAHGEILQTLNNIFLCEFWNFTACRWIIVSPSPSIGV